MGTPAVPSVVWVSPESSSSGTSVFVSPSAMHPDFGFWGFCFLFFCGGVWGAQPLGLDNHRVEISIQSISLRLIILVKYSGNGGKGTAVSSIHFILPMPSRARPHTHPAHAYPKPSPDPLIYPPHPDHPSILFFSSFPRPRVISSSNRPGSSTINNWSMTSSHRWPVFS